MLKKYFIFSFILCVGCSISKDEKGVSVDFERMNWYAERAAAAYLTEEEIRNKYPDVVHVETISSVDVQYFIEHAEAEGGDIQVISVRGTENLANVKHDIEYIKSKNNKLDIYVHRGFDRSASMIYQDLVNHLDKSKEIRLTGHSLGAAISTLLMIYLYEDGYKVGPSINFGQPKFTNKSGVEKYSFLDVTRVVNGHDPVPLVPPFTLLSAIHGAYHHIGDEVILLSDEYFVYVDQANIIKTVSVESFWNKLGQVHVEEHFIKNYISNIESKLEEDKQIAYASRNKYIKE